MDSKPHGVQWAIIILSQSIVYAIIWLWNEYVASYVTVVFPVMILLLLIISVVADWIEPSRIPRWYYQLMILSVLIPLLVGALFYVMYGGQLDWLDI